MAFLTSSLATIGANVHHNNPIAAGVANTIATVAPWFEFVPFTPVAGRTLTRQYQVDADLTKFTDESTDLSQDATTSGNSINHDTSACNPKGVTEPLPNWNGFKFDPLGRTGP